MILWCAVVPFWSWLERKHWSLVCEMFKVCGYCYRGKPCFKLLQSNTPPPKKKLLGLLCVDVYTNVCSCNVQWQNVNKFNWHEPFRKSRVKLDCLFVAWHKAMEQSSCSIDEIKVIGIKPKPIGTGNASCLVTSEGWQPVRDQVEDTVSCHK